MSYIFAKRLGQVEDLPTVPETMQKVLAEIDQASSTAQSLQAIIERDPVITAKILKIANSSFYSPVSEISSVARAIVTMGFKEIRDLVVCFSLTGVFSGNLGFVEFNSRDLWLHAFGVGIASRMIAKRVPGLDPDDIFTAGVLHDLGRLVYCLYFKEELVQVLAEAKNSGVPLNQAEETLGLTHAEIGAYLTRCWKLTDLLVNVIRYHHQPQQAGKFIKEATVVNLADTLIKQLRIGWDGLGETPTAVIPKVLGLDVHTLKEIAQQLREEREKIIESWGVVLG